VDTIVGGCATIMSGCTTMGVVNADAYSQNCSQTKSNTICQTRNNGIIVFVLLQLACSVELI
jgi:hypothetical protein